MDGENIGVGTLSFDTVAGLSSQRGLSNLTFAPRAGASSPQEISLDMIDTTGYAMQDSVYSLIQDGYTAGQPIAFVIDEDGFVAVEHTNGILDNDYKIPFFDA